MVMSLKELNELAIHNHVIPRRAKRITHKLVIDVLTMVNTPPEDEVKVPVVLYVNGERHETTVARCLVHRR